MISESISAGSGNLSILFLSEFFNSTEHQLDKKQRLNNIEIIKNKVYECSKILREEVRKASKDDIVKIIKRMNFSSSVSKLLNDILQCAEMNTFFDVSQSPSRKSYYQNIIGNEIQIDIPQVSLLKNSSWVKTSVDTLIVDGIIESVSQIHHILERASSKKSPTLIFCKSASEEVRKTIDLNFARSTIDLLLVETGFEIKNHHLFKDMSAVFDCDYVNIKMGDTISSNIDKLMFTIDKVIATNNSINLSTKDINTEKISRYTRDVRGLKDSVDLTKMDAESLSNFETDVDQRLKFLSSKRIDINIGKEDIDQDPYVISKIDGFLRSFSDIGFTGIVDLYDIRNIDNPIISTLIKNNEFPIFTQRQIFQSLLTSFRIFETISKAEKIFTIDSN